MTVRTLALLAVACFAANACGGGGYNSTAPIAFGSVGNNIFFDAATGAPENIPGVNSNTSVTRTFDTPGIFTYSCHIHPFMQGKVVVN